MGAAVLSFCHNERGFSGVGVSTVPQSPVFGSIAGSLAFFHSPSGGAEKALLVNSRRLREDSRDRSAKMGAVALGFSHHKCVVATGTVTDAVMPLTDHSSDNSSFLRHRSETLSGDFQSGPSIETVIEVPGFLTDRMDCVVSENSKFPECNFDQSFDSVSVVANSFRAGVVFEDQGAFSVPDIGGRHSSRGREKDSEAGHIRAGARGDSGGDAKKSGGAKVVIFDARLFTDFDRAAGIGTGIAGWWCGLSHFGGTNAKARDSHSPE